MQPLATTIDPTKGSRKCYPIHLVVLQFDEEASQTRDYGVARNATRRAARPDSSE